MMENLEKQLTDTLDWLVIRSLAGTALAKQVTRIEVLLDAVGEADPTRPELVAELEDTRRRLVKVEAWKPSQIPIAR